MTARRSEQAVLLGKCRYPVSGGCRWLVGGDSSLQLYRALPSLLNVSSSFFVLDELFLGITAVQLSIAQLELPQLSIYTIW